MTQHPIINAIYYGTITPSEGNPPASFLEYQKVIEVLDTPAAERGDAL